MIALPYLLVRFRCSIVSKALDTHSFSTVQSACRPHIHPVECRLKSQVHPLPWRHSHLVRLLRQEHGVQGPCNWTRCRPKVVPPVFWMWRKTITSVIGSRVRGRNLTE